MKSSMLAPLTGSGSIIGRAATKSLHSARMSSRPGTAIHWPMMWIACHMLGPKTRGSFVGRAPHAMSPALGVGGTGTGVGPRSATHDEPFQEHLDFRLFFEHFFLPYLGHNCSTGTQPASPAFLGPAQPQLATALQALLHLGPGHVTPRHWALAPSTAAASTAAAAAAAAPPPPPRPRARPRPP